jgi:hypothetical protein
MSRQVRFHFQLPGREAGLLQRIVGGVLGAILGVAFLIVSVVVAIVALPVGLLAAWLVKRRVRRGLDEFQRRVNEVAGMHRGGQPAGENDEYTPSGRKKVNVRVVDEDAQPDSEKNT